MNLHVCYLADNSDTYRCIELRLTQMSQHDHEYVPYFYKNIPFFEISSIANSWLIDC